MYKKIMLLLSSYSHITSTSICGNDIFTQGSILHVVQTSGIYTDSKTFVDMKLKHTPAIIKKAFTQLMATTWHRPTKKELDTFLDDHFALDDLKPWTPLDYKPNPEFLRRVYRNDIRQFAQALISIWPQLGRKLDEDVIRNCGRYTYIPLPHGLIVPGGRFRECYYWDTYWVVKGLLICEMFDTVKGILQNFATLVRRWGFVPNGNRIYYLCKSQPPLLTPMVYQYYKSTRDVPFVKQMVDTLEYEMQFWLTNRFVNIKTPNKTYVMYHYNVDTQYPRPESYREDLESAKYIRDKEKFYKEVQTATESGWDFSSRWLFDDKGNVSNDLSKIETSRVIPVDLNSFLFLSFKRLSKLYGVAGMKKKQELWRKKAEEMKNAINTVLWHEKDQIWYDYDMKLNRHRRYFYVSNFTPLWVKAYSKKDKKKYGKCGYRYLRKHEIKHYFKGGVPVSMRQSGQQWDYPNCWPPYQAIIVQGLFKSGYPEAQKYSKRLAKAFVTMCCKGMEESGLMQEKYDATHNGRAGTGGEYDCQCGFGWTNGICLEFIHKYYTQKHSKYVDVLPMSLSMACVAGYFIGSHMN